MSAAPRIAAALAAACSIAAATAQPAGLTGEQVYRETCSACHATGVDKAPKLGDRKAWAPLIREGQHVLTAHAWVGVRKMPPRGGRPELTLAEFSNAVAHMARQSGGRWKDPDAAMLARIEREVAKREAGLERAAAAK